MWLQNNVRGAELLCNNSLQKKILIPRTPGNDWRMRMQVVVRRPGFEATT